LVTYGRMILITVFASAPSLYLNLAGAVVGLYIDTACFVAGFFARELVVSSGVGRTLLLVRSPGCSNYVTFKICTTLLATLVIR